MFMRIAVTSFYVHWEFSWGYFIPAFLYILQFNPFRPFSYLPGRLSRKIEDLSDRSENYSKFFKSVSATLFCAACCILWTDARLCGAFVLIGLLGVPRVNMIDHEELDTIPEERSPVVRLFIEWAPILCGLFMLAVASYIYVVKAGKPHLLISALPFAVFVLMAVPKVPIQFLIGLAAVILILGFATTDTRLLHAVGMPVKVFIILAILRFQQHRETARMELAPAMN